MGSAIMAYLILIFGIASILMISGEAYEVNPAGLRSPRSAAAAILLLLLLGTRWLPAIGIDPRAAVNGSFAVAFGIVILIGLAHRNRA